MTPVVVAVTGLPGTGKSTLAEALGRALGAPVVAGDRLLGAVVPTGVLRGVGQPVVVDLHDRLLTMLATRQAALGQSAVVDAVLGDAPLGGLAVDGARLVVVECVCSDEALHRSRIEGRRRDIPGWHEVDWAHVERMRALWVRPTMPRLVVDAVVPVEVGLARVLAACAGSVEQGVVRGI